MAVRVAPDSWVSAAFAGALAALVATAGGCGPSSHSDEQSITENAPNQPQPVAVTDARLEVWPRTVLVQGSLLGDEQAVIGAKIAGRVEKTLVDLGSQVEAGDPLVVLDRRELELTVQQAEAQLRQACAAIGITPEQSETELRREEAPPVLVERALLDEARAAVSRAERLASRQSISDSEAERLQAQLKTAEARYQSALNDVGEQIALIGVRRAELALARQRLEDATITAPFAGVVERRQVAPGEYVQVGQAVVTLVRTDKLRFTAGVPESKAHEIRPGQAIALHVAGEPAPVAAVVSRVSPMVAQSSRALWIEADVPNPDRRYQAGLFAEAEIVVDPRATTLAVPVSAVTEFAGIEKTWIVREGEASEQPIRTGRRRGGLVEVLEGVTAGDQVVSNSREGRAGAVLAVREPVPPPTETHFPAESAE